MATKKTRFALSTEQFKNGLRPTQGDFADVFESFINFEDDLDEDAEPVHFKNGLRVGSGPANPLDGTVRWKERNFQVYRQIGNQGKWITLGGGLWLSNSAGNIHSDGKNVGIGTPDPKAPLDFGESTNPRRKLALFQYRDGNGFYGLGVSSETLELYSGKDPLEDPDMVIKQWSGSVGIGTLSPDPNVKLHVNGKVKIDETLDFGQKTGKRLALFQYDDENGFYGFGISSGRLDMFAGRNIHKETSYYGVPDLVIKQGHNFSEPGNVGIGIEEPHEKLHVNGNLKIDGEIIQEEWIVVNFLPGFQNMNESDTYGLLAYYKDKQGIVHIRGVAYKNIPDIETICIFKLGENYKPPYLLTFLAYGYPFGIVTVVIEKDGVVRMGGFQGVGSISLSGISFRTT